MTNKTKLSREPSAYEARGELFKTAMGARNYAGSMPIYPLFKDAPIGSNLEAACEEMRCAVRNMESLIDTLRDQISKQAQKIAELEKQNEHWMSVASEATCRAASLNELLGQEEPVAWYSGKLEIDGQDISFVTTNSPEDQLKIREENLEAGKGFVLIADIPLYAEQPAPVAADPEYSRCESCNALWSSRAFGLNDGKCPSCDKVKELNP